MAVDQERGSGREAGRHGQGVAGVELDQDEAVPGGAVAVGFRPELVEEGFLELEDFLHVHADNEGFGSGGGGIGEKDIFEFIAAGRKDGSPFVDFRRVKEVEDGEVLDLEDLVHAFEAESPLAVQEIGDVSLFKTCLLGESEACQFPCIDSVPKNFSKIILQDFELHGRSIALENEGGRETRSYSIHMSSCISKKEI